MRMSLLAEYISLKFALQNIFFLHYLNKKMLVD